MVSCHDLLAVRGGLGEDTDCPASLFGRYLQKMIIRGLRRATVVACSSTYTWNDLKRLVGDSTAERSPVILLGLNQPFTHLSKEEAWRRLQDVVGVSPDRPFILQIGQNLRRKNREGVLRVMKHLADRWQGQLVFAGMPLNEDLAKLRDELGLRDRVVEVVKPPHEKLEALLNTAHAMLFPSRFEGFGWPIIEAQACGCPVICSDRTSLPEVAGEGAMIHALEDEAGMADAVLALQDETLRAKMIDRGFQNIPRFGSARMIREYLELFQRVAKGSEC